MRSGFLALALAGCSFGPVAGASDAPLPPDGTAVDAPDPADAADAEVMDAPVTLDAPPAAPPCPDDAALLVCFSFDTGVPTVVLNEGTAAAANATLIGVMPATRDGRGAAQLTSESSMTVAAGTGVTGVRTFEIWVNLDAAPPDGTRFGIIDAISQTPITVFYHRDGARRFLRFDLNTVVEVDRELPIGTWTHLAMVCRTDGTLHAYVGGTEVGSAGGCAPGDGISNGVYLGRNNEAAIAARAPDRTLGKLDDVRLWTRALTDAEISDRASASAARR